MDNVGDDDYYKYGNSNEDNNISNLMIRILLMIKC